MIFIILLFFTSNVFAQNISGEVSNPTVLQEAIGIVDLSDVNSSTPTNNNILIANGTGWDAIGLGGSAARASSDGKVILRTLQDIDGDTKVQVEEGADDDVIRFDANGNGDIMRIGTVSTASDGLWPGVGIGIAPAAYSKLAIDVGGTYSGGAPQALSMTGSVISSATTSNTSFLYLQPVITGIPATFTGENATLWMNPLLVGSTWSAYTGIYNLTQTSDTTTDLTGIKINDSVLSNTTTNYRGIWITDPNDGGTITNGYGIDQEGSGLLNRFAGKVQIGTGTINSITATAGNFILGDGALFSSVSLSGDVSSVSGLGSVTLATDSVGTAELADINSTTPTQGRFLVGNGQAFDSVATANVGANTFTIASGSALPFQVENTSITNSFQVCDASCSSDTSTFLIDSAGRVSIRGGDGTSDLSFGQGARSFSIQNEDDDGAGGTLTINAGDTGGTPPTDTNGGNIILNSGDSTGSGSSTITFNTARAGASGTTTRSAQQAMTINTAGAVDMSSASDNIFVANTITAADIADVNSTTPTAGNFLIANGESFNSMELTMLSAADPTVNSEGELAWDSDDENMRVYDGAANRAVNTVYKFQASIYDPDSIQPTEDAVPILAVETDWAPFGITLISVGVKTDASSTYAVNFEEWTSPTDGAPSTIENVSTSSTTEAEDDGSLSDSAIAVGSIIYADLPATAIDMLQVWGTYYINSGN